MKTKKTNRGFSLIEFNDLNGEKCSLQKSSIASCSAIWLGVNDPYVKVMASKAKENGVITSETTGWVDVPLSDDVSKYGRMHLTQDQVKELLPVLKKFAKTGEI